MRNSWMTVLKTFEVHAPPHFCFGYSFISLFSLSLGLFRKLFWHFHGNSLQLTRVVISIQSPADNHVILLTDRKRNLKISLTVRLKKHCKSIGIIQEFR